MKSKKHILNYLAKNLLVHNNSKLLDIKSCREYSLMFRDIGVVLNWYFVSIRGGYIRGYIFPYSEDTYKTKLAIKESIDCYQIFAGRFREMTPNLGWYND